MIERRGYLKEIRNYYHTDYIKIIKGIRRCGKSTIIRQIINELKNEGIDDEHIKFLDFDLFENNIYTNTTKFSIYIKSLIKDDDKYYLFFDEIQNVVGWEKVLNSFNINLNISIFVTGSNCDLASNELTSFLDKYKVFTIYPLSFKEYCDLNNIDDKLEIDTLLNKYLDWGGFPQLLNYDDNESKKTSIIDVYNSIVIKDIVHRFNVKDIALLNRIVNYILNNLTKPFSVNDMASSFDDYNRKISLDTIYNYLEYINKSFIINKVERYDINNKRIISGKYKYYLTDFSFANLGCTNIYEKGKLENIVYNELVYRGYNVNICSIGKKEIDFIATKEKNRVYIQVCPTLEDTKDSQNIFKLYKKIKDNYPKYIISMDNEDFSQNGIIHLNIKDFLLSSDI